MERREDGKKGLKHLRARFQEENKVWILILSGQIIRKRNLLKHRFRNIGNTEGSPALNQTRLTWSALMRSRA